MKTFTLILIFSGLTGLNRCSSDLKFNLPFNTKNKEINSEKAVETIENFNFFQKAENDSLTSNLLIPNYYFYSFDSKKCNNFYSLNYI